MSWGSQLEATAPNPKPGTPDPRHAQAQWPLSLCEALEEMEGTPGCDPAMQSPLAVLSCAAQPYHGFGATGCQGPPSVITTQGRGVSSLCQPTKMLGDLCVPAAILSQAHRSVVLKCATAGPRDMSQALVS